MKRFSLNTKRAAKVLALTLAAAMVVPNVPVQKLSAEPDDTVTVELPEVIGSNGLDSTDSFTAGDTKGKALRFTSETVTETFVKKNASGEATEATFSSVDKATVKDDNGDYVYEDVDVTPIIVNGKNSVKGGAVSLKDTVKVERYPSAAPDAANEIQSAKTYRSGVEIENPFVACREDLYDASRYDWDVIYDTATEVTREMVTKPSVSAPKPYYSLDELAEMEHCAMANDVTISNTGKYRNRYSAPEAKEGVTISFWAKAPYDEKKETMATTNFFEFSNTESLVYKTDDLAKAWIAYQYQQEKDAETLDDPGSPFYIGDVVEGTVVSIREKDADPSTGITGTELGDDFKAQNNGNAFDAERNNKFKFIMNEGIYAKWNPDLADSEAAIEKEIEGQYKVYVVSATWLWNPNQKGTMTVDIGDKDFDGHPVYYVIKWSDTVYADGADNSYLERYSPTDECQEGKDTKVIEGATGYLYAGTSEIMYFRDSNTAEFKTGKVVKGPTEGDIENGEANTNAAVYLTDDVKETMSDEEWHYYTVTISDEWFQLYVDGEAMNPNATVWYGNTFNQGSGMYRPNGRWEKNANARTDWQKISNDDIFDTLYGQLFGTSVMNFITDPNTKLYIGGKTQNTAANTVIDEMKFYKEMMTAEQAAYEYSLRQHDLDEVEPEVPDAVKTVDFENDGDIIATDGTTGRSIKFTDVTATQSFTVVGSATGEGVLCGDINKSGEPDADDALAVLNHVAGSERITGTLVAVADINKSGEPDADDALAILNHVAGSERITEVIGGAETYDSVDKVPEKDDDGNLVYEDFDVAPEVVADEAAGKGNVVELKDTVSVVKYPSAAPDTENEIQSEKTYYSGAQIENPFADYREELFEEERFTFENVAATATEVERKVIQTAVDGWEYDETNATWPTLKNRYSAPEAKAGVTISFWAQVPFDEKTDAAAKTNFFEFSNTESLIYSSDDMAKVWIADQYAKEVEAGTVDNTDSPFYIGEVTIATVTAVNGNCEADYESQTGAAFSEENNKFTYLKGQGAFMKWNPKAAESDAAIAKDAAKGQYKVYAVNTIDNKSAAANKEIVVESGLKNAAGEALYYHLKWSDTVYADGAEGSYNARFCPTDDAPVGAARTIQGATGQLFMATNQTYYIRDTTSKTGVDVNELSSNYGTNQNGQVNTNAGVINPEVAEAAEDEAWHYYTITITDEWFQVYVDGVACDPSKSTSWNGNTFNLGSSLYRPDGVWVNSNARSDFQKLNNDDWTGSIYGQLFGVTVMDYITDANTKLYVGGKTQTTVAGTRLDDFAFYTEALDEDQVLAEYTARAAAN